MVAGVGAIDLALFIVAADDGWMPQTEEHFQILQYLNVKRAIVALTKIDLAEDLELVLDDVKENLIDGPWETAEVVPVSSHTGAGIDQLRDTIAKTLSASPPAADCEKPRLPVDRAFSLKGIGTVVAGTLIDGSLSVGNRSRGSALGNSSSYSNRPEPRAKSRGSAAGNPNRGQSLRGQRARSQINGERCDRAAAMFSLCLTSANRSPRSTC